MRQDFGRGHRMLGLPNLIINLQRRQLAMEFDELISLVNRAGELARRFDAEYFEIRAQADLSDGLFMRNGVVEAFILDSSSGLSVRMIVNGGVGFASTNHPEKLALTVEEAYRSALSASKAVKKVRLSAEEFRVDKFTSPFVKDPLEVPLQDKVEFLKAVDAAGSERGVAARVLLLLASRQFTHFINSEGAKITGDVRRVTLRTTLTLVSGARSTQEFEQPGGSGGWEIVEKWRMEEKVAELAENMKERLEKGSPAPRGKMDVVLGPKVTGLVAHESTGHPYEADRILGREAAQAGESFVKPEMLGQRIGSEVVTVIDDPTIPGSYGFYMYDAEGVRARPRVLMKAGIINEFLHNRETAAEFGVRSNASARASRFDREPIIRMANTYIAPGDMSVEELIEGISEGVYIKRFMEWNIDDRRYNQRYVGSEAYAIRGGRLAEPVLNPILEVTTRSFYSSIDGVGKDLEFEAAFCGKGDPGQSVPVWTGGPSLRLRGVGLGGV